MPPFINGKYKIQAELIKNENVVFKFGIHFQVEWFGLGMKL